MSPLEAELLALGTALDAPDGAFLETRVRAEIAAPRRRRRWRYLVAALLVGAGATYANVPAVAEWLGVKGVEVRFEPSPSTPVDANPFAFGRRVQLRDVDVLVPRALGSPNEVWINAAGTVWLVYPDALLMQADMRVADHRIATKFADANTTVEALDFGTGPAFWIEGGHYVSFFDRRGDVVVDRVRASRNVLLWEQGDITLRLESGFDRDESLRIAKSVS